MISIGIIKSASVIIIILLGLILETPRFESEIEPIRNRIRMVAF